MRTRLGAASSRASAPSRHCPTSRRRHPHGRRDLTTTLDQLGALGSRTTRCRLHVGPRRRALGATPCTDLPRAGSHRSPGRSPGGRRVAPVASSTSRRRSSTWSASRHCRTPRARASRRPRAALATRRRIGRSMRSSASLDGASKRSGGTASRSCATASACRRGTPSPTRASSRRSRPPPRRTRSRSSPRSTGGDDNARLAQTLGPRAGDVAAPSAETLRQLKALGYVE